jgi:hypothetical protein
MSKFKVAYIDEVSEDIREFQRFADDFFETIPIQAFGELDDLYALILENHVDAVVVDHNLIEYDKTNTINYEGNDVVNKILETQDGFPVFVLTAYDEDAIDKNDDAKIVFEKRIMFASEEQPDAFEAGIKFKKLISKQIEKYKSRVADWEKTLLELLEKGQKEKLDANDEAEVLRLDSLIEKALDKRIAIPDKIKKDIEEDKLGNLLKKVDELSANLGKKE